MSPSKPLGGGLTHTSVPTHTTAVTTALVANSQPSLLGWTNMSGSCASQNKKNDSMSRVVVPLAVPSALGSLKYDGQMAPIICVTNCPPWYELMLSQKQAMIMRDRTTNLLPQ